MYLGPTRLTLCMQFKRDASPGHSWLISKFERNAPAVSKIPMGCVTGMMTGSLKKFSQENGRPQHGQASADGHLDPSRSSFTDFEATQIQ